VIDDEDKKGGQVGRVYDCKLPGDIRSGHTDDWEQ